MRKPHFKISHHGYNVAGDNVRPRKVSGTLNPQLATSDYNLGSGIELAGLVGDGGWGCKGTVALSEREEGAAKLQLHRAVFNCMT
ncbi:hypothetical protein O988_01182 [Pseudogymnoascus sp. VKM F-3808]|nr:hypothetical protein O988_01182 [Pseudogymnoascus sp. VKM F-3808]